VTGEVVFPGWDSKFLISVVEEGNQRGQKSLSSPYKYHPGPIPGDSLEDKRWESMRFSGVGS